MNRAVTGIIAFVTAVSALVFISTLVRATYYAPETEGPPPQGAAAIEAPSAVLPARLSIPSLSIDAKVQHLGVNAKGAMMAPSNFTDVGWYKYGTVPGHVGSAVIDGHVDNGLGLAGVFKHLGDINRGDDIYVTDENGQELHFVVDAIETYPFDDPSIADKIFGQADAARLTLVTCAGTWVKGQRTYNERLVVYAKLASS